MLWLDSFISNSANPPVQALSVCNPEHKKKLYKQVWYQVTEQRSGVNQAVVLPTLSIFQNCNHLCKHVQNAHLGLLHPFPIHLICSYDKIELLNFVCQVHAKVEEMHSVLGS